MKAMCLGSVFWFLALICTLGGGARVPGLDTYRDVPGVGRYRLHVDPKPYADAMLQCENEEAHLAVPTSKAAEEAMVQILRSSNWLLAYIGVNDIEEEGRMDTVQGDLYSKVGYTRWEYGEPNDSGGIEDCVIFTRNALLNDWNCSSSLGYFCAKNHVPYTEDQVCIGLPTHPSLNVECNYNGTVVSCAQEARPGTAAIMTCAPGYENVSGLKTFLTTCLGGTRAWSKPLIQCDRDCGRIPEAVGQAYVVGGADVSQGGAPWHVGVYVQDEGVATRVDVFKHRCGGTLVTTNVVISAAHCFWDEPSHRAIPASKFRVAAGKLAREWDAPDADAQRRVVSKVTLPTSYKGLESNYQQDIAVVRLSRPVRLGGPVNIACLSFNLTALNPGENGTTFGWGLDESNAQSQLLKSVQLAYVPFDQCWALFANNTVFRRFITADKMCAGWTGRETAVCPGDSGGGLVFPRVTPAGRRFYLRGVVSVGPVPEGRRRRCSTNLLATFTDVTLHATFLKDRVKG